jgi:hypothetical protein
MGWGAAVAGLKGIELGLGGLAGMDRNRDASRAKSGLQEEQMRLGAILRPIGESLTEAYAPGGAYETALRSQGMEEAAMADLAQRREMEREALNLGGIRSGAFAAPRRGWARFASRAPIDAETARRAKEMMLDMTGRGARFEGLPDRYDFRSEFEPYQGFLRSLGGLKNPFGPGAANDEDLGFWAGTSTSVAPLGGGDYV